MNFSAFANEQQTLLLKDVFGEKAQITKAVEELLELAALLMHGSNDKNALTEEIADVYNMLAQLIILKRIDKIDVEYIAAEKMRKATTRALSLQIDGALEAIREAQK